MSRRQKKALLLDDLAAGLVRQSKAQLQAAAEEKAGELAEELAGAGRKTIARTLSRLLRWGDKHWGK